jgi:hypothetical protein
MNVKVIRLQKTSKPSTLQPSLVTLRTIIQFLNVPSKIFSQHLLIENPFSYSI